MNQYQPRDIGHQNHQDFIGYLSNLISCPDPIKAYLCKLYQLHRIPVFRARAQGQVKKLVKESERLVFVGDYPITDIFQVSLDKARLKSIEDTKAKIESRLNNLNVEVNKGKVAEEDLGAKKKEVKCKNCAKFAKTAKK